jgi:type I restriction enzyme R subunit
VEAEAVNKWLFNIDTVDKVLAHLMTRGRKVAGGDRLGKTIVFAKNQAHAEFIYERFNVHYPHYKGEFARTITFKTEYAQSLIDKFYIKEKAPHIAISVDMLDTGIDVPEIVNLVFFKLVRSKTKFWQMLGRGTRLCPDLFGPGWDKKEFYVFDYCQNLEFFSHDPETTEGTVGESLGKRLFLARLELVAELDKRPFGSAPFGSAPFDSTPFDSAQGAGPAADHSATYNIVVSTGQVLEETVRLLYVEVAAMNLDNFVVRPKRRLVEKYAAPEAWTPLSAEAHVELAHEVAGLPSELDPEAEETKRFDLLMLNLQLALLRAEPAFVRLAEQVRGIAGLLEEKAAIPMVREQLPLILEIQTDEWWQDVTVPMLEVARKRLRSLVKLIEKKLRKQLVTDFEDEMGDEVIIDLPGFTKPTGDFEKFRAKAQAFLRQHEDHIAIHKLRKNKPLTKIDLEELERILLESGVGSTDDIIRATKEAHGLGLFVRSLVGLDREAAKEALATFLEDRTLGANQIEFVNLIVNHLTEHGIMDAGLLYESPFTDIAPQGPDRLFTSRQLDQLVGILDEVALRAAA